ncbi:MAG TPA: response regulator [Elusimicrobiales bacterium]|nr:response regulator [Elusimicrobiales bacterium]
MKILLAEDDGPVRELMTEFLTDLGHEVTAVENGQELVKLALDARPDLVVTDMHMPEMAGNSMIAMIDMYPPLAGVPVIMVTGASDSELEDAGIPAEITVISKPVDFARLTAEVNKVAGKLGGS